jgi:O-antigen/teichoic acid export membrane protein
MSADVGAAVLNKAPREKHPSVRRWDRVTPGRAGETPPFMSNADEAEPPTNESPSRRDLAGRVGLKRIVVNTLTSQLDRVIDALVFMVLIPVVVHTVGQEHYGLWSLVWAVVSLFAVVDFGFGASVVKYVADARGKGDSNRLRRVVCTLFWVFVAQSAVLGVVSLLLLRGFGGLFDLSPELRPTAEIVFVVVASGFLLKLPTAMFRGVLTGDQKLWLANLYQIATNLLYFGAVLVILPRSPDLETFAFLNWIVTLLPGVAVALHCAMTMRGEISVAPRHFDRSLLREIWGFSAYQMVVQVGTLIGSRADMFVVKSALPLTAVAVYAIALRVSEQARTFCVQITRTLTPVVAELHSAGQQESLIKVWLTGTRFTVAFTVPLIVGCAVLAEPLIGSWLGPDFADTVLPLQLLLASTLAGLIHGNSQNQLAMTGDQRFLALAMCLGQTINIGLSLGLVVDFGLPGVAAATLMGPLATDVCLVQPRLGAQTRISPLSFYRQTVLPSMLPAVVMVAFQHALRRAWHVDALWEVAVVEALNVLVFWAAFWRLGVSPAERQFVSDRVRARFSRVFAR